MNENNSHQPKSVQQVMISSTFTDLQEHRRAMMDALNKLNLHPNVMEYNDGMPGMDVVASSLKMVRESAAYILLIGYKYGQTPECEARNPDQLSITELEFNEAQLLDRPTLLFIMGEGHDLTIKDMEEFTKNREKLERFRERAKKWAPGTAVDRVYTTFNSLVEFKEKIGVPISRLKSLIEPPPHVIHPSVDKEDQFPDVVPPVTLSRDKPIPQAPAFYAEPDYIGSHQFVGRARELEELNDWAKPADPTNLLLYEAIGGNGKSMLTWEWLNNSAPHVRDDWAGRFWYSFYERGAVMADFCRRALAYMTGQPLEELKKKKTTALMEPLLAELHDKPWLLVLDGLERVLVAYHRIDAAEMLDEDADSPKDKIADRDPRDAIREEDSDLLRALAAAAPSKILISSRLTPRVLLNPSGQPINGAKRMTLPGLRPADAEQLLRSCGIEKKIEGDSEAIQKYLTTNCDNHPLVIGILGGLINNYLPARGSFDQWAADAACGEGLDLAKLNIIQRRNHILRAALADLPNASKQLLSTLALLSDSVDYETLAAFNPHLPDQPIEVAKPNSPDERSVWNFFSEKRKKEIKNQYAVDLAKWKEYQKQLRAMQETTEYREAPQKLFNTVSDLEQRGLLQYDRRAQRYDLHPVVRGVAAGGMKDEEKQQYGMQVVDHFNSLPTSPYDKAETLEDLRPGLEVVRTLLKLGQFQPAAEAFRGDLLSAMLFNVEAYHEVLSLLRPFFLTRWEEFQEGIETLAQNYLLKSLAIALGNTGDEKIAMKLLSVGLPSEMQIENWRGLSTSLRSIGFCSYKMNRNVRAIRCCFYSLELAEVLDNEQHRFVSLFFIFVLQTELGKFAEAEETWQQLDPMGRSWPRSSYRQGSAEYNYAKFQFAKGTLEEQHLETAERLALKGKNRQAVRNLHRLRGRWRFEQGKFEQAAKSFAKAVRLAREIGVPDEWAEAGLALARFHLGELTNPEQEAHRLAQMRKPDHYYLARLWLAIRNQEEAKRYALAAYEWAWADGEPYVRLYDLNKATELLNELGIEIPQLKPYDESKDEPFEWEADLCATIDKLRAEKEARQKAAEEKARKKPEDEIDE